MMRLLTLFSLTLLVSFTVYASDSVRVTFIGPESMHIEYTVGNHPDTIWLAALSPGVEALQEVTANGTYRFEPPETDNYRFALVSNETSWVILTQTGWNNFHAEDILGTMLFDETIDNDNTIHIRNTVYVPEGISLSLVRCNFSTSAHVSRDFVISGTVSTTENVTYPSWTVYDIYAPQNLDNVNGGRFFFNPGSGGSLLQNASGISLHAYTSLSINDSSFPYVICGDHSHINMNNSRVNDLLVTGHLAQAFLNYSEINDSCTVTTNASLAVNNTVFDFNSPVEVQNAASFSADQGYIPSLHVHAPNGSCELIDITTRTLHISAVRNAELSHCHITWTLVVTNIPDAEISVDHSRIRMLDTERTPITFTSCDFYMQVRIHSPSPTHFNNCQFLSQLTLYLYGAGHDKPVIENNSFLGETAIRIVGDTSLTNEPVVIGRNYYGDPQGPIHRQDSTLFSPRGALVTDWAGLQMATPLKKGPDRHVSSGLSLWRFAIKHGQGTIPHSSRRVTSIRGRETLIVLDAGVNRHNIDDIEFRAYYTDDDYVVPTRGQYVSLKRDYSSLSSMRKEFAQNTVNFIIPSQTQGPYNVNIVWRHKEYSPDFRQIAFLQKGGGRTYKRPLRIHVIPVATYAIGYPRGAQDPTDFVEELRRTMSAKFPIAPDQIRITYGRRPLRHVSVYGSLSLSYLLNRMAAELTAGRKMVEACNWWSGEENIHVSDFTIGLLQKGVMSASGADGASPPLFPSIIFSEGDPDATLHEIGHLFDLWRNPEQYDAFPPFGKRVAGLTAFVTEPDGLDHFVGEKKRIRHFPDTNVRWYVEQNYFDIMGGTPGNVGAEFWPVYSTADRFSDRLHRLLNEPYGDAINEPVEPGMRRIYIQGKIAMRVHGSYGYTHLVPWSFDVMDITEFSGRTEPGPEAQPMSSFRYRFDAFDVTGGVVHTETFRASGDYFIITPSRYSVIGDWYRTFDVPQSAVSYTITGLRHTATRIEQGLIWEVAAGGNVSTDITYPTPGSTIDGDFIMEWQSATERQGMNGIPVSPLRHMVWSSTDGGNTWQQESFMQTGNKLDFSYHLLPADDEVIFSVMTSDGFSTDTAILSDLSVTPHPPSVTITAPHVNDRGTTGTVWSLSARVHDKNNNTPIDVSWTSSLDGHLGMGTTLDDISLSIGTHTLTCNAQNSEGLTADDTIIVHVTPTVDYAIEEDDLWLINTKRGPYVVPTQSIHTGTPATVSLAFRSPGTEVTSLYAHITMTTPDDTEHLLSSITWSNIPSFTPLYHEATVTPHDWGEYTFTAALSNLSPEDTGPGSTQRSLHFSTIEPPRIAAPHVSIDFGYLDETEISTNLTASVYNAGGQPLHMGQLRIGGGHADAFSIVDDPLSMSTLAPGETGTVSVTFTPTYVGRNVAHLALPCNDPLRDAYGLNLTGDYLTPEPGIGIVVFGALLFVRMRRSTYYS